MPHELLMQSLKTSSMPSKIECPLSSLRARMLLSTRLSCSTDLFFRSDGRIAEWLYDRIDASASVSPITLWMLRLRATVWPTEAVATPLVFTVSVSVLADVYMSIMCATLLSV